MTHGKASEAVNDKQRSEYFLEKLVGAPSISGDEAEGVKVCRDLMTEIGLTTRLRPCAGVADAYNVEGSLGSARPKLCIAGHVDTLPFEGMTVNPLGERRGNRYYGRGTSDMKGGLAAVLAAVDRLGRRGVKLGGQLVVIGTASEETLKCGGYQLAQDHHDSDGVVCAEPSDCRVAVAATGSLALRLDAFGVNAHSSVPGSGGNAILAAQVAARAVVDALSETIDVPYVGKRQRAVNVGVIRGGIAQPVVPQRCTVWLDVRYFVGETAAALMERIGAVCAQAVSTLPGVRVEASQERLDYEGKPYPRGSWGDFIHVDRGMKAFATDPTTAVVKAFRRAVKEAGGDDGVDMMRGWGDVEFVATDHGVPTIYFGPGTVAAAHTADEYIELDRYHMGITVYELAIQEFLGTA
jgi:acetylornithine deacetylase/succinyl-diaminopimelate desuccinylase-like protein